MCLVGYFATAQGTELGIIVGGSAYSGDLSPKEFGLYTEDFRLAGGILARFPVSDYFNLRVSVIAGRVSSTEKIFNDSSVIKRPAFQSTIGELSLVGEFYPLPYGTVQPYLFGGVGVYRFNPQAGFDGGWVDLQPLGTEGQGIDGFPKPYSLTQFNLPFGAGVKFVFNETWTLGAEFGWRKLFTDYLDDVGTQSVSYSDVYENNGALAAFYSNSTIKGLEDPRATVEYRRGGSFNDWYMVGGITLTYFLNSGGGGGWNGGGRRGGKGIGCPTNF